ncbi:MAG TPA: ATP-binding protein, partial [Opitutus sp.]|nr:ATP-binding protein [Opitutus sp.]
GVLWIGTVNVGVIRYKDGAFSALGKRDGLASDRVLSLAESDDGSLWVGTEDGLSQLSDVKFPILSSSEGLPHEAALAVATGAEGDVWVGTPDGLSHYRDGKFANYGVGGADGFTSRWIKRLYVARDNDVYVIGARKNIDRFSGGRVVKSWANAVWPKAIAEDSRGLLMAIEGRLMRLEGDELQPFLLADGTEVSLRWITDMLVARDDSIWIAATEGVFQIVDGVIYNRCHLNGVYHTAFYYLCETADGAVWAAQNTGIARFKDGRLALFTKQQGLHENFVYAMMPDRLGYIWMDSTRGIFRVSERELNAVADGLAERVSCDVFDGEDSVKTTDKSAQEYSAGRTPDGRIWFPSSKGVIVIDPANVPLDARPPHVSIERVLINGREYSPDRVPTLEPTAGNLEFHYAALNYAAPLKTRYRYRLEGYETAWVDAGGRRSAFYTNLAHGRYRFHVQACNADGVWNTTGDAFALVLPARFYETLWFRVAWAAGAIALLGYIWWMMHLRRKHQQLRQTHDLLEAKVQERTAELRAEIEEREKVQKEVERVHRELLEISRQAGMAEVATGVLHNVGNVLTSLNVSATLLHDRIRESKVSCVAQLRDLLRGHAADLGAFLVKDPRGRQVPDFVTTLADHLATEQAELMRELESLRKNVEHIRDIVAMQQNYARVSGVTERVAVQSLVEDALRMNEVSLARHAVELVRDYRADPVITVEKHKVLQILVNLLRNAKYACEESGRDDRRIVVRISAEGGGVQITVSDNGVGISRENLTRIFSHGFTTKKSGHGFGLHNGALGAKNIGGSLTVNSGGAGKGATFVLELPEEPPAVGV